MECWSNTSEGKSLLFSDDMDLLIDRRTRKVLVGWEMRNNCEYDNDMLMSYREAVENSKAEEINFPEMTRQPIPINNPNMSHLGGENGSELVGKGNIFSWEEENGSRISSSVIESTSQDSSLMDLKLGNFADFMDSKMRKSSEGVSVLSSLPAKRARPSSFYSQTPLCQVHGCNMDLSFTKEYYRRHKVCDVHSKTARVIVKGIEQRFCQQCSRFHLLAEFDDGKRSCRKRLAGHNERRRKPQLDNSNKVQKLLQLSHGPFISKETSSLLCQERHNEVNQHGHIKLQEDLSSYPQLSIPNTNENKISPQIPSTGKQIPSKLSSLGTTRSYNLDTALTVRDLSGLSNSSCALSLLSEKSQNLWSHSGMCDQNIILGSFGNFLPDRFYSSEISSSEFEQVKPIMLYDEGHTVDFEIPSNGPTIDLLQLSSHLQRIEQQKSSAQVKQENNVFCCFPSI